MKLNGLFCCFFLFHSTKTLIEKRINNGTAIVFYSSTMEKKQITKIRKEIKQMKILRKIEMIHNVFRKFALFYYGTKTGSLMPSSPFPPDAHIPSNHIQNQIQTHSRYYLVIKHSVRQTYFNLDFMCLHIPPPQGVGGGREWLNVRAFSDAVIIARYRYSPIPFLISITNFFSVLLVTDRQTVGDGRRWRHM